MAASAESIEWQTVPVAGNQKRGPGTLRDFLTAVVLKTLEGESDVNEKERGANLVKYARGPLYASQTSAASSGRVIKRKYGPMFGGKFEWFTKLETGGNTRLMVRFIPNEAMKETA